MNWDFSADDAFMPSPSNLPTSEALEGYTPFPSFQGEGGDAFLTSLPGLEAASGNGIDLWAYSNGLRGVSGDLLENWMNQAMVRS